MAKKKGNKKSNWRFLYYVILFISLIFIALIGYINILPIKYFIYFVIGLLIIDLFFFFMFCKRKKGPNKFVILISFIYLILVSIASFYIIKTNNILDKINVNYKTYNFSVVVKKESSYQKLDDLKNKKIGYYQDGKDITKKANNKIESNVDIIFIEYRDINNLVNALFNDEVDAIVIEDGYRSILNDQEENIMEFDNFDEKVRIIYTFKIREKLDNLTNDIDITKKAFNVYISGIDTYGEISSVSRSDVNIVVTINPATHQILLTSIPRDYYVKLYGNNNCKDKLTHAGLQGVDMSIGTIEDLLSIDINYYFKVNFTSVIDIIDSIGGVDVYSDYSFTSIDGYQYKAGWNHVNGEAGLSFVRERKAFSAGDRQRGKNQQAMIEAIIRQCLKPSILSNYNSLLNSLDGSFITSMNSNRLISFIKMQLNDNAKWNITSNSLDGTNSYNYTCSYGYQKLYVMEPLQNSVINATDLINKVINGELLDSSYQDYNGNSSSVNRIDLTPQAPIIDNNTEIEDNVDSENTMEDSNESNIEELPDDELTDNEELDSEDDKQSDNEELDNEDKESEIESSFENSDI